MLKKAAKLRLLLLLCGVCLGLASLGCSRNVSQQTRPPENEVEIFPIAIDINSASPEELEKLPRIGKETARKIVEHRERHGKFRRAEHLILVRGMSDKKFREIKSFVKAGN